MQPVVDMLLMTWFDTVFNFSKGDELLLRLGIVKKLYVISFLVFFSFMTLSFPLRLAVASESQEKNLNWDADKNKLKLIFQEKRSSSKCASMWDILWPQAKGGNLEARAILLYHMYSSGMILPGDKGDSISKIRNIAIIGIHSVGVKSEDVPQQNAHHDFLDGLYKALSKSNFLTLGEPNSASEDFFECAARRWTNSCAQIMVENHLIPSFDDFSKEIDLFASQGEKARCSYPNLN